jgi:hypothetical protein
LLDSLDDLTTDVPEARVSATTRKNWLAGWVAYQLILIFLHSDFPSSSTSLDMIFI